MKSVYDELRKDIDKNRKDATITKISRNKEYLGTRWILADHI